MNLQELRKELYELRIKRAYLVMARDDSGLLAEVDEAIKDIRSQIAKIDFEIIESKRGRK